MKIQQLEELNKPYSIFAETLEQGAIDQFVSAMGHDAIVKGAMMPDAHTGYSLPIGSVVASDGMIFPSFVGYDIGCGMCALKMDSVGGSDIRANAQKIFDEIYKKVPVGNSMHNVGAEYGATDLLIQDLTESSQEIAEKRSWFSQLGTLGGGNHFIEIGEDENGCAWIVIHSGSRGTGHGIAGSYMKLASNSDKPLEGNFGFRVDSQQGQDYLNDFDWALQYALDNRSSMILSVEKVIKKITGIETHGDWDNLINRNHNHATLREIDGRDLWIHRKGATHAEDGMMGVIPGNMRDGSFIVRGKGNQDSLFSSSHGAGRVLGRKQAQRELNLDDFKSTMNGIYAKVEQNTIDESPFAYKDIFEVMDMQKDMVDVVAHVVPIVNIKG
jgi:tRNA-splicing ligase RtcB